MFSLFCKCSLKPRLRLSTQVTYMVYRWGSSPTVCIGTLCIVTLHDKIPIFLLTDPQVFDVGIYSYGNIKRVIITGVPNNEKVRKIHLHPHTQNNKWTMKQGKLAASIWVTFQFQFIFKLFVFKMNFHFHFDFNLSFEMAIREQDVHVLACGSK